MRILITIAPRMYRPALALSIRRQRPEHEVVIVSPEAAAEEIAAFEPHMLLHNDNDKLGSEAVAGILCRITVLYTDGMNARIAPCAVASASRGICPPKTFYESWTR